MKSLGVIALTLVVLGRVVHAQPTPGHTEGAKDRAAALMKDAARAYQGRDYGTALTRFQEAYAVFPSPRILFNLGQSYEQLGRYVEATESFQRFLASDDHAPGRARAEAQRSLEAMRDRVARVEVVSNVAGAEVSIDGQPHGMTPLPRAVVVAVGSHQVSVRKAGAEPFDRRIDAVGGTMARVDAQLRLLPAAEPVAAVAPPSPAADAGPLSAAPPRAVPAAPAPAETMAATPADAPAPASSSAWRTAGLGLAIAAPALIGTGVYFGIQARNEAKAIAGHCQMGCAGKDILAADRAGRQNQTVQWVLIGTGAAALAGGAALFFFSGSPAAPAPVSLGIGVGDGGAAATIAGSF